MTATEDLILEQHPMLKRGTANAKKFFPLRENHSFSHAVVTDCLCVAKLAKAIYRQKHAVAASKLYAASVGR